MAAITWQNVVDFEALIASVPIAAQTAILADVNTRLNVSVFNDGEDGADLRLARIYLAAHAGLGCLPHVGVGGGPIASISGGDGLAVTYSVQPLSLREPDLMSTSWGRKYLGLINRTPGARAWIAL